MCTLTFIPRTSGYMIAMNRDERRSRVKAVAPDLRRRGSRWVLGPAEPGGGRWIAVNDAGNTFALLNWYAVPIGPTAGSASRGEVVTAVDIEGRSRGIALALKALPLSAMGPFRLLGFFPGERVIREWRWDQRRMRTARHVWEAGLWASSGYDEARARRRRKAVFLDALRRGPAASLNWIRRLHRGHLPERGPFSICMHREDAVTVSYTEISVGSRWIQMGYIDGAPCTGIRLKPTRLALDRPLELKSCLGEESGQQIRPSTAE